MKTIKKKERKEMPLSTLPKHHLAAVCLVWITLVIFGYYCLGVYNHPYFLFGPNSSFRLLGLPIDSWSRWWILVCLQVLETLFHDLLEEHLFSWIRLRVIQEKSVELDTYERWQLALACQVHIFYSGVFRVISVFVMFTQLDLTLITLIIRQLVGTFYLIPIWLTPPVSKLAPFEPSPK